LLVDFLRPSLLHLATPIHDDHPIGHGKGLLLVVGDIDGGDAHTLEDGSQLVHQPLAQGAVEGAQGLVQHEQARAGRQAAGQGHPLLLATRQLVHIPLLETDHPHQVQHLGYPRSDFFLRQVLHPQAKGYVFEDILVGKEGLVLEHQAKVALVHRHVTDVVAFKQHLPAIGGLQPGNDAQQCGLAAAGRTQQAEDVGFHCRCPFPAHRRGIHPPVR
jgi:hypothetical protein